MAKYKTTHALTKTAEEMAMYVNACSQPMNIREEEVKQQISDTLRTVEAAAPQNRNKVVFLDHAQARGLTDAAFRNYAIERVLSHVLHDGIIFQADFNESSIPYMMVHGLGPDSIPVPLSLGLSLANASVRVRRS